MLPNRLLKLLLVSLFFTLFVSLFPMSVHAQTSSFIDSSVPQNMHTQAQIIMIETSAALLCQITGIDIVQPQQGCLGINRTTNHISYNPQAADPKQKLRAGGLLGYVISMIGESYNVPIHSADFTNYAVSQFGMGKKVYADNGTGFSNLTPYLKLWTRIRDLVYLAFVLLFVLIGLAIMLRIRIDPKTTMSIQNQIPKVIITLLLITFSYSIAGALIDSMWVVTYTGINLLTEGSGCTQNPALGEQLGKAATQSLLNNPLDFVSSILNVKGCAFDWADGVLPIAELSVNVGDTVGRILSTMVVRIVGIDSTSFNCNALLPGTWGDCAQQALFDFIRFFVDIIASLIIFTAIIVQLFRVWFALIKTYIYFILYTILAPIWIVLGIIPGVSGFGFADWVRHMLFSLSVFPVTAFLFLVAIVIANDPNINTVGNTATSFVPPLVANPSIAHNFGYVLALGIILLAPEVTKMMRSVFKSPESKYTPAIWAGLGAGAAAIGPVGQSLFGKGKDGRYGPGSYYLRRGLSNLPGVQGIQNLWNRSPWIANQPKLWDPYSAPIGAAGAAPAAAAATTATATAAPAAAATPSGATTPAGGTTPGGGGGGTTPPPAGAAPTPGSTPTP